MINFYLVRHGEQKKEVEASLTEIGIQQAQLTASYFSDKQIDLLISSPLQRTKQTSEIIAKKLDINIIFDARLKERLNWGDVKNQSFDDFLVEWVKTLEDRNYKPLGGDSSFETGTRMNNLLDDLVKQKHTYVLLVTSGGAIKDLVRNLFSDEYLEGIKTNFIKDDLFYCSITHVIFNEGKYIVKEIGSTEHLCI